MFNQWYWPVICFLWCLGLFLVSDWCWPHSLRPTSPEYKEGMYQKATNQTSCFRCEVAFYCSFIRSIFLCLLILPHSLCSVCWLLFTILESAQVGDVLWGSTVHSPLVISCICSRGAPNWTAWALLSLHGQLLWVCPWVRLTPVLVSCQTLFCLVVADLLVGSES